MALNAEDTSNFIRTVLNITTSDDFKVIRANQSGRRPAKPYATYLYTGNVALGASPQTDHTATATELTEEISTVRSPTLEVQFFTKTEAEGKKITGYESANDISQRFEDNIKSDRVKRYLRENCFSVLSHNTLFNLDEMLGDKWERRAAVEITLNEVTVASNSVEFFNAPITFNITAEDI